MTKSDALSGISYRIETPDGTMFVHVSGETADGLPTLIQVNIGKSGSPLAAWADATARLATRLLPHVGMNGVIQEISGITADKVRNTIDGPSVRSGAEGICVALLKYRAQWFLKNRPENTR